jgi:hypothetical protein
MSDNWIVVYSTDQLYDASLLENILKDNGIDCVIMNKQDSTRGFGDIEIYVSTADALQAKQLILTFKGE